MKNYKIVEWGQLPINDSSTADNTITSGHARSLVAASEKLPLSHQVQEGVLTMHSDRIKARGIVGVIQTKTCSLEIWPKIGHSDKEKDEVTESRKRLIEMLKVTYNLKIGVGKISTFSWQNNSLLELLIGMFISELSEAVKMGLPQKYIEFEGDLPILRGTLNIVRQYSEHIANPTILACWYDQFSQDIPINQVLKSTVVLLSKISKNSRNQQLLRELSFVFTDITHVPTKQLRWDLISINRTNERWRTLLNFAKLLLNQRYQTTTNGSIEGYSLLFEMNKLFEEYVGRLILKVAVRLRNRKLRHNIKVSLQKWGDYCLRDKLTGKEKFKTRPDIIIECDGNIVQVIDTKWKSIKSKDANIWATVDNNDFYQMKAYSEVFKSPRVTLIYPHDYETIGCEGVKGIGHFKNHKDRQLEVFSFKLSNQSNELDQLENLITLSDNQSVYSI